MYSQIFMIYLEKLGRIQSYFHYSNRSEFHTSALRQSSSHFFHRSAVLLLSDLREVKQWVIKFRLLP